MNVLTRLRGCRRASGLVLAALTALGAGSATLHSHAGDSAAEQPALRAHVPISIIADPDAPSAAVHLHSGSTVPSEPCPACVLSSAHGTIPTPPVVAAVAPSVCIPVVALQGPVAAALVSSVSRSPPATA